MERLCTRPFLPWMAAFRNPALRYRNLLRQPYVDATFAELYAVLRGPYSGRLNGFGGEPFVQNNAHYGGQYVEPDSVRDVGEGGNYGGYGFYGNGQNQNSAPDSWSDVPQETYKYNGPEQTINPSVSGQAAANDRVTDVKKSEGGPGRGYYLNGKFYPYTDDEKKRAVTSGKLPEADWQRKVRSFKWQKYTRLWQTAWKR